MFLFALLLELVRPGLAIQVRHNSSNHRHHGPPITIIKEIIQISHTVLHLRHSQQHHLPGMEKVEKGNISGTAHRLSVKLNFLSAFLFSTTPPRLFLSTIILLLWCIPGLDAYASYFVSILKLDWNYIYVFTKEWLLSSYTGPIKCLLLSFTP